MKTVVAQLPQKSAHVVLVVVAYQGKGYRKVAERVGGQLQRVAAQMDFVDAQGAGELCQRPVAVVGVVELLELPAQAVIDKSRGQLQEKVPPEGCLNPLQA